MDVFDEPGSADLTANVDFTYLREALSGLGTYIAAWDDRSVDNAAAAPLGPLPQSQFLLALGLQPRLEKLLASAPTDERRLDIQKGAKRLIDTLGMGRQYQVMGIIGPTADVEVYPFSIPSKPTPGT